MTDLPQRHTRPDKDPPSNSGIEIIRGLAIVADGRYLAYETSARSTVTGGEEDIDYTPLLLSAGLRFQF